MKRLITIFLLLLFLTACGKTAYNSDSFSSNSFSYSSFSEAKKIPVVYCHDLLNHPSIRMSQFGFMDKANELKIYDPQVIETFTVPAIDQAQKIQPKGILFIIDPLYFQDFTKEISNSGVKIVLSSIEFEGEEYRELISCNPYEDPTEWFTVVAKYMLQQLSERKIEQGVIVFSRNRRYYPSFVKYIEENSDFVVVDNATVTGGDMKQSVVQQYKDDIVAVYSDDTNPDEWETVLGNSLEETGILYVASYESKENLNALKKRKIQAIITVPRYEQGYVGMEMLDRVLKGETFTGGEWHPMLPVRTITADGTGKNGPDFYLDLWERVEAFSDTVEQ